MLLRITKVISEEKTKRIMTAKKQIDTFFNLLDTSYLYEDLNLDLQKKLTNFAKPANVSERVLFQEEIGAFPDPEHFLQKDYGDLTFKYDRKSHAKPSKYFLAIKLSRAYNDRMQGEEIGFSLELLRKGSHGTIVEFEFGNFKANSNQEMADFFNYFSCQSPMYQAIFEKLVTKKALLESYLGKTFTNDLITLFSYQRLETESFTFETEKASLEKRIFFNATGENTKVINKNLALLGDIWSTEDEDDEDNVMFRDIYVRLGENHQLSIDFSLPEDCINKFPILLTDQNLAKLKENKSCTNFITKNLKNWLEDLVNFADFEAGIYNKIKTKFLLKTISKI